MSSNVNTKVKDWPVRSQGLFWVHPDKKTPVKSLPKETVPVIVIVMIVARAVQASATKANKIRHFINSLRMAALKPRATQQATLSLAFAILYSAKREKIPSC